MLFNIIITNYDGFKLRPNKRKEKSYSTCNHCMDKRELGIPLWVMMVG